MHIDRLLSVAEAMELLSIRTTKFYELVAVGDIALVKVGTRSFVRASELQRFIDGLPSKGSALGSKIDRRRA